MGKEREKLWSPEEAEFFDMVERDHLKGIIETMRRMGCSEEEIQEMLEDAKGDGR